MFGLPGLSVATRSRPCPIRRKSRLTSSRPSIWPSKFGRSTTTGAEEMVPSAGGGKVLP
jgi:hypothetical protein